MRNGGRGEGPEGTPQMREGGGRDGERGKRKVKTARKERWGREAGGK